MDSWSSTRRLGLSFCRGACCWIGRRCVLLIANVGDAFFVSRSSCCLKQAFLSGLHFCFLTGFFLLRCFLYCTNVAQLVLSVAVCYSFFVFRTITHFGAFSSSLSLVSAASIRIAQSCMNLATFFPTFRFFCIHEVHLRGICKLVNYDTLWNRPT